MARSRGEGERSTAEVGNVDKKAKNFVSDLKKKRKLKQDP